MTDNATATPAPVPLETTPTVVVDWTTCVLEQVRRERDLFLALVDERERLLIQMHHISGPRTAEIRKWWRERNRT